MKTLLSLFHPKALHHLLYMLQQVEYSPQKYLAWLWRMVKSNQPLYSVEYRHKLKLTRKTRLLEYATVTTLLGLMILFFLLFVTDVINSVLVFVLLMYSLFIFQIAVVVFFATIAFFMIVKPAHSRLVLEASRIFADHKGVKIAVIGSYGKTSMKEMLATVLSEGRVVAATPGNMNVSVSHARFARKLTGKEDILIVEFGEGEPGDIARMASMLKPDYAVVTGLAPNHLDHYPNLEAVAIDLIDIYKFVSLDHILVNGESEMLRPYLPKDVKTYTTSETMGWQSKNINVGVNELSFDLSYGKDTINVKSGLIGRYQVAALSCAATLAKELGLKNSEIESGLAKTVPYEHRMQPRLVQGAWLIDDTYNGNLEGMKAGLRLLAELEAKRKWYVTPGLVDQGIETERVHQELGKSIADTNPDIVVLMENSARPIIQASLQSNGYVGDLRIETDPLQFYTSIEHIVAVGDLVLMQNDWTDNYN